MGADSLVVMRTMAKEFLVLVLISLLIALPAGWIIVHKLLQQFAYRIDTNIIVFAVIGVATILIAALTVGYQAYKASCINPARALKIE